VKPGLHALARIGVTWPLPTRPATTVLAYHHVRDDVAAAISPAGFADQMAWLAAQPDLPVVSLRDALNGRGTAGEVRRSVVITFDDAYDDTRATAMQVVADAGFPATVYVPSRLLGRREHMSAADLLDMVRAGFEVGSHSRDHVNLRECDRSELEAQIVGSKADLEDLTGAPVRSFAYPYGLHRERVRAAVAAAGYESAVVCEHGWLRRGIDVFRIPRVLLDEMTIRTFAAVARGGLNLLAPLNRALVKRRPH
jgi:peptidoglycan/xylan/chitin deacetylase (PgdA/CDA1 family)